MGSRMWRLYWPILGTLLLEGFFLGVPLVCMGAATALAFIVYLTCEAVRAYRNIIEAIDRVNAEQAAPDEDADVTG
jgi:hypothetical protein